MTTAVSKAPVGTPNDATTTTTKTPCDKVRDSCAAWVESDACKAHVTIDASQLQDLTSKIRSHAVVVWDEEAWHYQPPAEWPAAIRSERIALYILALDAINFCFWPVAGYEYEDLASTLTAMCQADHAVQAENLNAVSAEYALSASALAAMTADRMTELFQSHTVKKNFPPDMDKRCALWNEVGQRLDSKFQGSALKLIEQAEKSAVALVQLLIDNFPGFCDFLPHRAAGDCDCDMYFLKRCQICVGDWNAALQLELADMDQLTTFADYRVPQLLRHWNVLQYSDALAASVDASEELTLESEEEISIRAATVTAVELLVRELNLGPDKEKLWTAVQTDWYLWQVGERMQSEGKLKPHHRVRTIYY